MAQTPFPAFNPAVNMNFTEFGRDSRPISDLPADKSNATIISGVGDILQAGATITDDLLKKRIQADIYEQVDPLRDQFNKDLQDTKTALLNPVAKDVKPTRDPNWQGPEQEQPINIIPTNSATPAPAGVQTGLNRAMTVAESAKNNQGGISQAWYDGELDKIAKQLRNQYPMYRPYIDEQMSSITGRNPANSMISSQIEDINKLVQSAQTSKSSMLSYIRGLGDNLGPVAGQLYEMYNSGQIDDNTVVRIASERLGHKVQLQNARLALDYNKDNRAAAVNIAKDAMTQYSFQQATQLFNDFNLVEGYDSPNKIAEFVAKSRAPGGTPLSAQQSQAFAQQVDSMRELTRRQLFNEFNKPGKDGTPSMWALVGETEGNKIINDQLMIFDKVKQSLIDKDIGTAYESVNMATMIANDKTKQLFGGNAKNYFATMSVLNKAGGQFAVQEYVNQVAGNAKLRAQVSGALQEEILVGTTSLTNPWRPARTILDSIERLKSEPEVNAETFNSLTDITRIVTDKRSDDYTKASTLKFLFSPKSAGFIKEFDDDVRDANGNRVPGKLGVFTKMTEPTMVKEIARLDRINPQYGLKSAYQSFLTLTMRETFGNDIKRLSDTIDALDGRNFLVGYDHDTQQFKVELRNPNVLVGPMGGTPYGTPAYNQYQDAKFLVENVNIGLRNYADAQEALGSVDKNTSVLQMMKQQGYNPTGTTMIDRMYRAVTSSHKDLNDSMKKTNSEHVPSPVQQKAEEIGRNILNPPTLNRRPAHIPPVGAPPMEGAALNFAETAPDVVDVNTWMRNPSGVIGDTPKPPVVARTDVARPRSMNLIDNPIISQSEVMDIPEGMTYQEFLKTRPIRK